MTREEAEVYARCMTYRDAICNALQGKCIPYRKATFIKLYELLDKLEQEPCEVGEVLDKIRAEIKALSNSNPSYWHSGDMVDRDDVLEIIDKYKAESEDE